MVTASQCGLVITKEKEGWRFIKLSSIEGLKKHSGHYISYDCSGGVFLCAITYFGNSKTKYYKSLNFREAVVWLRGNLSKDSSVEYYINEEEKLIQHRKAVFNKKKSSDYQKKYRADLKKNNPDRYKKLIERQKELQRIYGEDRKRAKEAAKEGKEPDAEEMRAGSRRFTFENVKFFFVGFRTGKIKLEMYKHLLSKKGHKYIEEKDELDRVKVTVYDFSEEGLSRAAIEKSILSGGLEGHLYESGYWRRGEPVVGCVRDECEKCKFKKDSLGIAAMQLYCWGNGDCFVKRRKREKRKLERNKLQEKGEGHESSSGRKDGTVVHEEKSG